MIIITSRNILGFLVKLSGDFFGSLAPTVILKVGAVAWI
jgi:hypothetical protein